MRRTNSAVVLEAVKAKPKRAREGRGLDRPCARQRVESAGRKDGLRAGAEQKDATRTKKQQEKEDATPSDAKA